MMTRAIFFFLATLFVFLVPLMDFLQMIFHYDRVVIVRLQLDLLCEIWTWRSLMASLCSIMDRYVRLVRCCVEEES